MSSEETHKQTIKDGFLEKKGHSLAYFNWSLRKLVVRAGEIAYYKEDDLTNALNIITLSQASVAKKDDDTFVVTANKKTFTFRIPTTGEHALGSGVAQARDEWVDAIETAIAMKSGGGGGMPALLEKQMKKLTGILAKMVKDITDLSAFVGRGSGAKKITSLQQLTESLVVELSELPVLDKIGGSFQANALAGVGKGHSPKSKPGNVLSALLKSSYVADTLNAIPVNIKIERESTDVKWGLGLGANNEITQSKEGSVAAKAGVELGYILTHVNDEPVLPDPSEGRTGESCMQTIEQALQALEVNLTLVRKPGYKAPKKITVAPAGEGGDPLALTETEKREQAIEDRANAEAAKREAEEVARKEKVRQSNIKKTKDLIEAHEKEIRKLEETLKVAQEYQQMKEEYDKAKQALEEAQAAGSGDGGIDEAKIAELQKMLNEAQAASQQAEDDYAAKESALEEAQAQLEAADDDGKADAEAAVTAAKEALEQAEAALTTTAEAMVEAEDNFNAAQAGGSGSSEDLEDAKAAFEAIEGKFLKLEEKLGRLTGLDKYEKDFEEAQEEVKEAQAAIAEAKEDAKDPETAVARAQEEVNAAEAKLTECRKNFEQSGDSHDKEELEAAEEALDKAKEALELASKPEFKLSVAEAGLAAAKKKLQDSRKALDNAKSKFAAEGGPSIESLEAKIKDEKQALTNAQSELTSLQSSAPPSPGGGPPPPPPPGMGMGAPIPPPPPMLGGPGAPPPPPPMPGMGGPPPPPPMPGMGGPPPPPPPPGMGGPPPPPGMPGFGMMMGPPARAPIKPRVKMRPFHWVKVPPVNLPKSFWQDLIPKGDAKVDADKIEDLFAAAEEKKKVAKKKKEQPKTLLDAKRGQNLGIFMRGFKTPIDQLDTSLSILPPKEGSLPVEYVVALRKLAPVPEEYESYKRYPGDKSQLSDIDQFLMKLMEVPNLKKRLDLLLTIHEFPSQFEELAPEISIALKACRQMNESRKLEKLMHHALSIGNYINGSTAKGGAHGFMLKSLPKMGESKGRDKKTTLLDFLVDHLNNNDKTLLTFPEELEEAVKATESSVKGLSAEVEILGRDLLKIDRGAKKLKEDAKDDISPAQKMFFDQIKKFVDRYEEELVQLHADVKETQTIYTQLLEKFGERPTTDSEEVFGHLAKFVARFKEAYAKTQETKGEKKESYAEKRAKEKAEKEKADGKTNGSPTGKSKGSKTGKGKATGNGSEKKKANPFAKQPEPEPAPAEEADKKKKNPFAKTESAAPAKKAEPKQPKQTAEEAAAAGAKTVTLKPVEVPKKKQPAQAAEPDMPDRAGGYGEGHVTKTYETNVVNPFKDESMRATSNPFAKGGKKSQFTAVAPTAAKAKKKKTKKGEPPSRTGWLDRLNPKSRKWEKRFFELVTSGYCHFYKKEGGKNQGSIYLRNCPVRLDPDDATVVLVQTEERLYTLRASSAMEAARWKEDMSFYV
eukprot:TRINITY_DN11846_c5_g1_i1.p1 TRINITY_DN11846_c5_g1~~TRINITY_DN11846_c5_g1_i1.p1  ORF type:complete len:1636 (+),score=587.46 TRINITY_DN11846_c5_g1_i1:537-4910(+)